MPKQTKVSKNAQKAHVHYVNSQKEQNNSKNNNNRHIVHYRMKKIKKYIKKTCKPLDYKWTIAHLASDNGILESQFEEKWKTKLNKESKLYCKNKDTIKRCLAMRLRNNLSKQN